MTILVTGAAGYIGSHVTLSLIEAGAEVVAVDNLCNSERSTLNTVYELTEAPIKFYECDVRNGNALMDIVMANKTEAIIHLAGLKSVADSVRSPLEYYENNVGGTLTLLRVMAICGVRRLVFSSSATVYGDAKTLPTPETAPLSVANPYGRTKLVIENMIRDAEAAGLVDATILRYFNPVGSHVSGQLGENPKGEADNLMPHICQAAAGKGPLKIFGTDYDTPDGTCLRDYIHVMDLAQGHIAALENLGTYNLGAGKPVSVLELIKAFEAANGVTVPFEAAPRREGDVAASFADINKAQKVLAWRPTLSVEEMCRDAWRAYGNKEEGDK